MNRKRTPGSRSDLGVVNKLAEVLTTAPARGE